MRQPEDMAVLNENYGLVYNKENFNTATTNNRHTPPMRRCSYSQVDIVDHSFEIDSNKKKERDAQWVVPNDIQSVSPHQPLQRCSYSQAELMDASSFEGDNNNKETWGINETIQKLYDVDGNMSRRLFLDEYFSFMKKKGYLVTKVPIVGKKPLDLYRLYHAVQRFGGFEQVSQKRKWSKVVRDLGLPTSITSAAYTLRTQFEKLLYRFECSRKGVSINKKFLIEEQKSFESIKKFGAWENGLMQDPSAYTNHFNKERSFRQSMNDNIELRFQVKSENSHRRPPTKDEIMSLPSTEYNSKMITKSPSTVKNDEDADGGDDGDEVESPQYFKRAKSEEIYRRNSLEDAPLTFPRSESCGNLYQSSRIRRKRSYSSMTEDEEEQEDTKELNNNNNFKTESLDPPITPRGDQPMLLDTDREQSMVRSEGYFPRKEEMPLGRYEVMSRSDHVEPPRKQLLIDNDFEKRREYSNDIEKRREYNTDLEKRREYDNKSLYMREKRSIYTDYRPPSPVSRHQSSIYPPYSTSHSSSNEIQNQCTCEECKQKTRTHNNKVPYSNAPLPPDRGEDRRSLLPTVAIRPSPTPPQATSPFRYPMPPYQPKHNREYEQPMTFPTPPPSLAKENHLPPSLVEQRYKSYRREYRNPYTRDNRQPNNMKLSTNPSEMNLKIKERTENAIVLSLVVDGVYYSGTLLTSIKR